MAVIDNLLSYWKLDEASGNRADAHGSDTLTDNNTVAAVTGIINNGADFTAASNESLSHATSKGGAVGLPISYNLWVYINDTSEKGSFLEDGGGTAGGSFGIAIGVGSGNFDTNGNNLIVPFWGIDWQDTGVAIGTGWHMITVVLGTDGKIKAYKDGTLVFTGTSVLTAWSTGLRLGNSTNNGSFPRYFDGAIDEVGIWSKALTGAEITSLYNAGAGLAYPFSSGATQNSNFLSFMT